MMHNCCGWKAKRVRHILMKYLVKRNLCSALKRWKESSLAEADRRSLKVRAVLAFKAASQRGDAKLRNQAFHLWKNCKLEGAMRDRETESMQRGRAAASRLIAAGLRGWMSRVSFKLFLKAWMIWKDGARESKRRHRAVERLKIKRRRSRMRSTFERWQQTAWRQTAERDRKSSSIQRIFRVTSVILSARTKRALCTWKENTKEQVRVRQAMGRGCKALKRIVTLRAWKVVNRAFHRLRVEALEMRAEFAKAAAAEPLRAVESALEESNKKARRTRGLATLKRALRGLLWGALASSLKQWRCNVAALNERDLRIRRIAMVIEKVSRGRVKNQARLFFWMLLRRGDIIRRRKRCKGTARAILRAFFDRRQR